MGQGDALLWSGELVHAGCMVEQGVRHILVGSFSLRRAPEAGEEGRGPRVRTRVRGKDFV